MRAGVLVAIVFGLALVGCSSLNSSSSDGAPFEVSDSAVATDQVDLPRSYRFSPEVITVVPGTTVTWTNSDDFPHNVHLLDGSAVTKDLPIGESAAITFSEPGIIYYECSIHPQQMRGKIAVEE
jgi:plastocyanin